MSNDLIASGVPETCRGAYVSNVRTMRQAIETKYLGPTDTKGARVRASSQARSFTVGYDHRLNPSDNHAGAAVALAGKYGWTGRLVGGGNATGTGYVFVFTD